jgi:hypothetical protein
MEGKAPSIELRDAFRSFARWLSTIYRQLRGDLKVNLDDEMRQVFDAMLATEEQITQAEAANHYQPLFTDAAMAGMTEAEFEAYQKKNLKSTSKAHETLRDKILAQLQRQTKKWWKEDLDEKTEAAIEELREQPVYNAIDRLRAKDSPVKMDRAAVKQILGVGGIPPSLRNMTVTGAQGISPDDSAGALGFSSGEQMITEIMEARPIKEVATEQAEAEMKIEHGDILNDGTLDQEAQEAAHNEERGKQILTELKQLGKDKNRPTIDRATIKQLAKENIGRLSLTKIRPAKYRRAEIKSAQAAQSAMDAGNADEALRAKTQQALNFYLWRAAVDAVEQGEKIVRYTRKFKKKSIRTKIMKAGNGYMEQIDGLLDRFSFDQSIRAVQQDRENIQTWAESRVVDGDNIQLSNEALAEQYRLHYKEVPFDILTGIADSLRNIDHVARFANKVKKDQEVLEFQEVKREVLDHLNNLPNKFNAKVADVTGDGVIKKSLWHMAQMTKLPMLFTWLDGGKRAGLMQGRLRCH